MTGVFRTSDERVTVVEEKSLYPDEELVADIGETCFAKLDFEQFRWIAWFLSWVEYFEAYFTDGNVLHENSTLWHEVQRAPKPTRKLQTGADNKENNEENSNSKSQ